MKAIKTILLGSTAALMSAAAAQAADLPSRKAAPIEYVRICDAYGSGFFFIPGTDTCLRVGGTVVGEWRAYNSSYRMSRNIIGTNGVATVNPTGVFLPGGFYFGNVPSAGSYSNARSGDNSAFAGTGRIELDARTATPLGALRTFIRIESYFGSSTSAATGSIGGGELFGGFNFANSSVFRNPARESTILNKAFIQFAGLTAGRVQSFFDFYVDNINWEALRGSNATVGALAYTYTFGDGYSGTLSIEDNVSRRGIIGSVVGANPLIPPAAAGAPFVGPLFAAFGNRDFGVPDGTQIPEIVGNIRWDQPWGAGQVSAAGHQLRTSLYGNNAARGDSGNRAGLARALAATPLRCQLVRKTITASRCNLARSSISTNLRLRSSRLATNSGCRRSMQQGAVGYIMGNNLSFEAGPVNGNTFYGYGNGGTKASNGWEF